MSATVRFTYHDYLLLPEGKRGEIIFGDLVMEPSPTYGHQLVLKNILKILDRHVGLLKLGIVLPGPLDVILSEEDIVTPDILFVSRSRFSIIHRKIHGAPDLIVEVLSRRDAARDRELKMKLYAKYGLPEYWVVDPEAKTVEVYSTVGLRASFMGRVSYELHGMFGPGSVMTSRVLPGFEAETDDMFRGPL